MYKSPLFTDTRSKLKGKYLDSKGDNNHEGDWNCKKNR